MSNNVNILRFLTFVRNDIFSYYDTVSKPGMSVEKTLILSGG